MSMTYFILFRNNANIETGSRTSYLEEMAMLRDMKRRRTKYKVSTKAKSYTEIMREVIDNQVNSSNVSKFCMKNVNS